jgi:aerobic-type carbon monoxide dehydrogenase small subunit (CoxS/CutS family)
MSVQFEVNGKNVEVEVEPRLTLADCLRHHLRLTGTHVGCEHGVCGACTVIVDGAAVRSCLMLAVQAEGAEIVTVEGLSNDDDLTPLQKSFRKHHALQGTGLRRSARARGPFGQSLPLHRLYFYRRGRARRALGLWP